MKAEHGRADNRLCDVLITYHSATQHGICKPAGDPRLVLVGTFFFCASLVAWHHLTHSRTALSKKHGGADDRFCEVLITYHRLQAKAFSE